MSLYFKSKDLPRLNEAINEDLSHLDLLHLGTTEFNRLQKLQNRAARIVASSSFDTPCNNQLIDTFGWKPMNKLINFESKTMVSRSLNELAPPYLRSIFWKKSQSIFL